MISKTTTTLWLPTFFAASDTIVNMNLEENFTSEVKVLEAKYFYDYQAANENVHAEVYSLMIDNLIKDTSEKNKLFNAIEEIDCIKQKRDWAEKWINNGNSTNQQSTNGNNTKNVSFNDTNEEFILESVSNEDTSNFNDNDSNASVNNLDTLDIFSKLKKKSNSGDKYQKEDEVSNSTLFKEILEIKQSISELKNLIISK